MHDLPLMILAGLGLLLLSFVFAAVFVAFRTWPGRGGSRDEDEDEEDKLSCWDDGGTGKWRWPKVYELPLRDVGEGPPISAAIRDTEEELIFQLEQVGIYISPDEVGDLLNAEYDAAWQWLRDRGNAAMTDRPPPRRPPCLFGRELSELLAALGISFNARVISEMRADERRRLAAWAILEIERRDAGADVRPYCLHLTRPIFNGQRTTDH